MPGLRFAAAPKTGRLLRILFVRLYTVSAEAKRRLMLLEVEEHRNGNASVAGLFLS